MPLKPASTAIRNEILAGSQVDIFSPEFRKFRVVPEDLLIEEDVKTFEDIKDTFDALREKFFMPFVWAECKTVESAKEKLMALGRVGVLSTVDGDGRGLESRY